MGFISSFRTQTPVPDGAAARKNLPAHLLAIVNRLERFVIPEYDTLADVYEAYPTPTEATAPALVRLRLNGTWQFVGDPYNVYAPVGRLKGGSGFTAAVRTSATPTVGPAPLPQSFGTTEQLTVGPFPWPHIITVYYHAQFAAAVNTDVTRGYVSVGTTPDGFFDVTGDGTATASFTIVRDNPADLDDPTILQGGMGRVSGSGAVTCTASDDRFTKLEVTVAAYLDGIGS